jgi:hypothetical protein
MNKANFNPCVFTLQTIGTGDTPSNAPKRMAACSVTVDYVQLGFLGTLVTHALHTFNERGLVTLLGRSCSYGDSKTSCNVILLLCLSLFLWMLLVKRPSHSSGSSMAASMRIDVANVSTVTKSTSAIKEEAAATCAYHKYYHMCTLYLVQRVQLCLVKTCNLRLGLQHPNATRSSSSLSLSKRFY